MYTTEEEALWMSAICPPEPPDVAVVQEQPRDSQKGWSTSGIKKKKAAKQAVFLTSCKRSILKRFDGCQVWFRTGDTCGSSEKHAKPESTNCSATENPQSGWGKKERVSSSPRAQPRVEFLICVYFHHLQVCWIMFPMFSHTLTQLSIIWWNMNSPL